jgi:hypothetical protein
VYIEDNFSISNQFYELKYEYNIKITERGTLVSRLEGTACKVTLQHAKAQSTNQMYTTRSTHRKEPDTATKVLIFAQCGALPVLPCPSNHDVDAK